MTRSICLSVLLATLGLFLISQEALAQFVVRPNAGSQSRYIPGVGVVRQNQYFDPVRGQFNTITHSYFGSNITRTTTNPTFRTIWVQRWVMTPFGPQLIRQPVTVPVFQ